jgi:hypothetical protein
VAAMGGAEAEGDADHVREVQPAAVAHEVGQREAQGLELVGPACARAAAAAAALVGCR